MNWVRAIALHLVVIISACASLNACKAVEGKIPPEDIPLATRAEPLALFVRTYEDLEPVYAQANRPSIHVVCVRLWPYFDASGEVKRRLDERMRQLDFEGVWTLGNDSLFGDVDFSIIYVRDSEELVVTRDETLNSAISWLMERNGIHIDWGLSQTYIGYVARDHWYRAADLIASDPELGGREDLWIARPPSDEPE